MTLYKMSAKFKNLNLNGCQNGGHHGWPTELPGFQLETGLFSPPTQILVETWGENKAVFEDLPCSRDARQPVEDGRAGGRFGAFLP